VLLPLVLAQFVCSFAGSSLNVAITDISNSLGTTVTGVQTAITLFTLTMAALMIPGSKLTDIFGRKRCFVLGLAVYGIGALIAAASPSIAVMVFGYSFLQGVGTALLIPPVYIFATVLFTDLTSRARAFGAISAGAGIGAAAGPLIGGIITTGISWRATFVVQAVLMGGVILLSRRISDPGVTGPRPHFDLLGAVLSAAGLFFIVIGILQAQTYGFFTAKQDFVVGNTVVIPQGGISPVWLFVGIGALLLVGFFVHIRSTERAGQEPLVPSRMFRNRTSNLGLVTQNIQWLILLGSSFVISVFMQQVRGFNAIQTGLILTPATLGVLVAGLRAPVMAHRRTQVILVRAGFVTTLVGFVLLLLLGSATSSVLTFVPGLLLVGLGVGVMLTSSVNIVQSSFPEEDQGEISGVSRSVSNLGSSLGVAIAGTILLSDIFAGNKSYAAALIALTVIGLIGLGAALLMPSSAMPVASSTPEQADS
jgi:MFS family permease